MALFGSPRKAIGPLGRPATIRVLGKHYISKIVSSGSPVRDRKFKIEGKRRPQPGERRL